MDSTGSQLSIARVSKVLLKGQLILNTMVFRKVLDFLEDSYLVSFKKAVCIKANRPPPMVGWDNSIMFRYSCVRGLG